MSANKVARPDQLAQVATQLAPVVLELVPLW